MAITLRATKGSALSHNEVDANFTTLDNIHTTNVASLLADTETYSAGQRIVTLDEGFSYEAVASGGHVSNAIGQEFALTDLSSIHLKAFGPPEDGSDATTETQKALDVWRTYRATGKPSTLLWDATVTCNSQILIDFDSDDQDQGVIDMSGGQLRSGVSSGSLMRITTTKFVQNLRLINFDLQNNSSTADVGLELDGGDSTSNAALYRCSLVAPSIKGFRTPLWMRNNLFEVTVTDPNIQATSENRGDSAGLICHDDFDATTPYGTDGGTITGNVSSILVTGGTIAKGDNAVYLPTSSDFRMMGTTLLDSRRQLFNAPAMESAWICNNHFENAWRCDDWAQSTAYLLGAVVYANTEVYKCVTAGTSAGSGTGPSGTGSGISDGTAVWDYVTNRGAADVQNSTNFALNDYRQSAGYANSFIRSFVVNSMTVPYNLNKDNSSAHFSLNNNSDSGKRLTLGTEARGRVIYDATAAETMVRVLQPEHHYAAGSVSGTYTHDMEDGRSAFLTATGNVTIANPTNAERGDVFFLAVKQDATGGRSISWGSEFRIEGKPATHPSATTRYAFFYTGASWQGISIAPEEIADGTVANLPAASSVEDGTRAYVTDATSPTFMSAVTGLGAVYTPVFSNGSSWIVG